MTTQFWLNDPSILFDKDSITELWPKPGMDSEQKLNAISRLVILLTVLGFLISKSMKILVTGLITLGVIVVLYNVQKNKKHGDKKVKKVQKEGFTNPDLYKALKKDFTNPTPKNPLMNVLLPEISYDPKRKAAAPAFNPAVEKEINASTEKFVENDFCGEKDIKSKLFTDLGDNFNFDNSMRNFYATPNTQIPNDQGAFADYLYGDMISCKEGNEFSCIQNNPRLGSIVGG